MKIYRPIQTNRKTQGFGENKACVSDYPHFKVVGKVNNQCPSGYKDFYLSMGMSGHNGEDWALWNGEPIYFPVLADIKWTGVWATDNYGGVGIDVISDHLLVKFRFWHLKKLAIPDKSEVHFGQLLGWGDSTGASSSPHLHWSRKKIDKYWETENSNNGYYGAEDFSEDFENKFVLEVLGITPELSLEEKTKKLVFNLTH